MSLLRPYLALAIAAALLAGCTPAPVTPALPPAPPLNEDALWPDVPAGRLLVALYVIGSDLEDDLRPRNGTSDEEESGAPNLRGQATADMKEIAAALAAMTPAERERIDVLVSFGGARQAGWRGVKTVDGAGLIADAADGSFGNADAATYLADEPGADMAQGATFAAFLRRVQARAAGSPRTMISLWNHGGGYAGLGPDTVSGGRLSLAAFREALETERFKAHVLAFDACLMASVEVAAAARSHFHYMLASSEVIPGHGWDYKGWLARVVARPADSVAQVAAGVVDTYLDSPGHRKDRALTMSVVNVAHAGALTASMDALAASLDHQAALVLDAAEGAQPFGLQGPDETPEAIDLAGFAAGLGPAGAALAAEVRSSVVYSRADAVEAGASGLTTFAVQNRRALDDGLFNRTTASSPSWFGLLAGLYADAAADLDPPYFGVETPAEGGWALDVLDRSALAEVQVLRATPVGGELVLAQHEHVAHAASPRDRYVLPAWDGRCLTMDGVVVPVAVRSRQGLYAAPGTHNGQPATLFVLRDAAFQATAAWIVPDQPQPRSLLAARQIELAAGDVLTFTHQLVGPDLQPRGTRTSPAVTFKSLADLRWAAGSGPGAYALAAADLHGNHAISAPKAP